VAPRDGEQRNDAEGDCVVVAIGAMLGTLPQWRVLYLAFAPFCRLVLMASLFAIWDAIFLAWWLDVGMPLALCDRWSAVSLANNKSLTGVMLILELVAVSSQQDT